MLKLENESLSLILNEMSQAIFLFDREGVIFFANNLFCKFLNLSCDVIFGKKIQTLNFKKIAGGNYCALNNDFLSCDKFLIDEKIYLEEKISKKILQFNLRKIANDANFFYYAGISFEFGFLQSSAIFSLDEAVKRHVKDGGKAAIFFIDIDNFKSKNDRFGHLAGDDLLYKIEERIRMQVRDSDFFFRYGGDEFILVSFLKEENFFDNAQLIKKRILSCFENPFAIAYAREKIKIGASVGLSFSDGKDSDLKSLIHAADLAMYEKKYRYHDKAKNLFNNVNQVPHRHINTDSKD